MAQASKTTKKSNIFVRLKKYLRDVWTELKRVTWPTRSEVLNSSMIVVATLIFFIAFTMVVDSISSFVFIEWLAGIGR